MKKSIPNPINFIDRFLFWISGATVAAAIHYAEQGAPWALLAVAGVVAAVGGAALASAVASDQPGK